MIHVTQSIRKIRRQLVNKDKLNFVKSIFRLSNSDGRQTLPK